MAPFVHHMSSTGNISTQTLAGNDWPDYTYLQIIFNDEYDDAPEICAADPDYDEDDRHSQVAENSDTGRLSTIQEGDDEDLGFLAVGDTLLGEDSDPAKCRCDRVSRHGTTLAGTETLLGGGGEGEFESVCSRCDRVSRHGTGRTEENLLSTAVGQWPENPENQIDPNGILEEEPLYDGMQIPTEHLSISPGLHYLTAGADASGENTATDRDDEGNLYIEILCPGNAAKLLVDEPPPPGTCARLRICRSSKQEGSDRSGYRPAYSRRVSKVCQGSQSSRVRGTQNVDCAQVLQPRPQATRTQYRRRQVGRKVEENQRCTRPHQTDATDTDASYPPRV